MRISPQLMIELLNTAREDDERLEELGDYLIELADDDKKINIAVIEALFKIHERLHDPAQSLFNVLEACVTGSQEKTVRKLARESVKRKLNHCNIQLVGNNPESVKLLQEILKRQKLDREWRAIIKEIIQEAENDEE